jgi:hypothetical protein
MLPTVVEAPPHPYGFDGIITPLLDRFVIFGRYLAGSSCVDLSSLAIAFIEFARVISEARSSCDELSSVILGRFCRSRGAIGALPIRSIESEGTGEDDINGTFKL